MKNIICIITLFVFASNMVFAVKYYDDKVHPPSTECPPKTYTGYHDVYYYVEGSRVSADRTSGKWTVGEGGETPWYLREVNAPNSTISIPEAGGTMKGKTPIVEKIEKAADILIKIIKSIDIRIAF